jgi:hypothetical protein
MKTSVVGVAAALITTSFLGAPDMAAAAPLGRFGRGAVERNSSAFQGGHREYRGFGLERWQTACGLRRMGRRERWGTRRRGAQKVGGVDPPLVCQMAP